MSKMTQTVTPQPDVDVLSEQVDESGDMIENNNMGSLSGGDEVELGDDDTTDNGADAE